MVVRRWCSRKPPGRKNANPDNRIIRPVILRPSRIKWHRERADLSEREENRSRLEEVNKAQAICRARQILPPSP